jgi:hypothetical protein
MTSSSPAQDWLVHQAFSVKLTGPRRVYDVTTQSVMNLGLLPPCFNAVLSAPAYSSTIQLFRAGQAEVLRSLLPSPGIVLLAQHYPV